MQSYQIVTEILDMLFRSAVDVRFYLLVVLFPLVVVRIAVPVLADANSTIVALVLAAIAPLIVLPAWILFGTHYRIDSTLIRICAGPFSWSIPLDYIHSVTTARSYMPAPALSHDRLIIAYGRNQEISVSPQRKTAFLEALGLNPATVLRPARQKPNPFALGENY